MAAMNRFDIRIIGVKDTEPCPTFALTPSRWGPRWSMPQRIVSRHINPLSPTVVSVGFFMAGKAFNIIPGEAELSGTTRTFDLEVLELLGIPDEKDPSRGVRFHGRPFRKTHFDSGIRPT